MVWLGVFGRSGWLGLFGLKVGFCTGTGCWFGLGVEIVTPLELSFCATDDRLGLSFVELLFKI